MPVTCVQMISNHKLLEMKNIKLCVLLLLLSCVSYTFAQKVRLDNCYVTHQRYSRILGYFPAPNGPDGMTFHVTMNVDGYKGKTLWCIIELGYYEGTDSYYFSRTSGDYKYNGHLAVCSKLCPRYDNSSYNDLQLFLPNSEITTSIGKSDGWTDWCKDILYCVKVIDAEGNVLLKEWQKTTKIKYQQKYNLPQNCTACRGSNVCYQCNGRGVIWWGYGWVRCPDCQGTGECPYCKKGGLSEAWTISDRGTFEPRPFNPGGNLQISNYPNTGTYSSPQRDECPSCHGRKVCKHCGGIGKVQRENPYTGYTEWRDCVMCNGSGTCQLCNGKGYQC